MLNDILLSCWSAMLKNLMLHLCLWLHKAYTAAKSKGKLNHFSFPYRRRRESEWEDFSGSFSESFRERNGASVLQLISKSLRGPIYKGTTQALLYVRVVRKKIKYTESYTRESWVLLLEILKHSKLLEEVFQTLVCKRVLLSFQFENETFLEKRSRANARKRPGGHSTCYGFKSMKLKIVWS